MFVTTVHYDFLPDLRVRLNVQRNMDDTTLLENPQYVKKKVYKLIMIIIQNDPDQSRTQKNQTI